MRYTINPLRSLPFLACFLIGIAAVRAQDNKPGLSASAFKGQIMVYADGSVLDPDKDDNFYLNFSGPAVRYAWGKRSVGLFFSPSMRMLLAEDGPQFSAVVCFGSEFAYRHLVLSLAEFYRNNRWEAALGVGYRF